MAVTIKKIAELAGVSTGTVDRALYDRGRVNPEVAKRIKQIAAELQYVPNKTARSLHIAAKNLKLAVILHSETNAFFDKVLEGIHKAANEISHNGVIVDIFYGHDFDAECQIALLQKAVKEQYNAIIVVPIADERIRVLLASIKESTPVYLLTNPLSDASFCEYVGCDYYKAGSLAAGLVNISTTPEEKKVAFFTPSLNMLGHVLRYQGFINNEGIQKKHLQTDLVELQKIDYIEIYKKASSYFAKNQDTKLVLANAMGLESGILKALEDAKMLDNVKIIAFDYSENLKPFIQQGTITCCIDQEQSAQGYKVVMAAFNSLLTSTFSEKKMRFVDLRILLKESL